MKKDAFISRKLEATIRREMEIFPTLTLTGPRQSGKTTLCRRLFSKFSYVNAEDSETRERIAEGAKSFLRLFPHGLIVDEAQRVPEIFSAAQVLVDEDRSRRFIFTGSCNFALIRGIKQSLAGRTGVLTLAPLSLEELGAERCAVSKETLIFRGGYPAVWNASSDDARSRILRSYYDTYIERDLRELVSLRELSTFRQFVRLCAGSVGCEFNSSRFANELGVSAPTVREWFSLLEASYIAFRLPPFFANIRKRIVRTPKLYFFDVGVACSLLGIREATQVAEHPLRGALFENLVVAEFFKRCFAQGENGSGLFFFRDSSQSEVDLVEECAGKLNAWEIKSAPEAHKDFFKGLKYFRSLFGDRVAGTRLICDTNAEFDTPENGVVNFRHLSSRPQ